LGSSQRARQLRKLRNKAPQLIALAIVVIVVVYLVLDFFEDVVIGGAPVTSEPVISIILAITRGVTSTVRAFGYTGIFLLMLLESSSLPIPSEVVLPFAGYLVGLGLLNFWVILALATVAGLTGSLLDYYIGLKGAESLIKHKVLGKAILSTSQLEVAEKWFLKHGSLMVFVSRLIPGFRTTFSFPAGAAKMSMKKFVAYTTAGCLLWNALLIYLGLYLGENWTRVAGVSRYLILAAAAVVIFVVVYYLIGRRRRMKLQKELLSRVAAA